MLVPVRSRQQLQSAAAGVLPSGAAAGVAAAAAGCLSCMAAHLTPHSSVMLPAVPQRAALHPAAPHTHQRTLPAQRTAACDAAVCTGEIYRPPGLLLNGMHARLDQRMLIAVGSCQQRQPTAATDLWRYQQQQPAAELRAAVHWRHLAGLPTIVPNSPPLCRTLEVLTIYG